MFSQKQRRFAAEPELTVKFSGLLNSFHVLVGPIHSVLYREIKIICAVLLLSVLGESVHVFYLIFFF